MSAKIQTNLSRFTDAQLINKADYIVTSITDNINFPDVAPPIIEVQAALTKFNLDVVAASGRDKVLVAEKNTSREVLLNLLTRLGLYIMSVARGEAAILASSGFPMAKEREPGFIVNPVGISVKNGPASGQLVCRVKPVKYAAMYTHDITLDVPNADANWTSTRSSRSFHVYSDLEPGTKYWFRVGAIRGNETAYSQIASKFVQ